METIDPWRGFNQGMQSINGSLAAIQQRKSQGLQDQFQAGQNQQQQMSLADLQAKQGALLQTTGAPDMQSAYAQQMEAEKKQQQLAADQKGLEVFGKTMEVLQKSGADAKTMTNFGKEALRQNPRFAPMVDNLTFVDPKGVKAARNFADGELKDPVTGQPLPAGFYETTGQWTGDAANPVKLVSYERKKDPVQQDYGAPYTMSIGGKKALVQKGPDGQIRPVIQEGANININAASGGQVGTLAQQVAEGRLDPNTISKRGGLQQAVFAEVEKIAPGFNFTGATANAKFSQNSGNLQTRALIQGVDTLYEKLLETGKELGNSSLPGVNKIVNWAKEQSGDPKIVAFNNLRDDVVAESERVLLGSGVLSDSKYLRAVKNVNSAQSYPQLQAAVEQLKLTVSARLEALDKKPFPNANPNQAQATPPAQPAPSAKAAFMKRATAAGYSAAEANAHWNKQQGR